MTTLADNICDSVKELFTFVSEMHVLCIVRNKQNDKCHANVIVI